MQTCVNVYAQNNPDNEVSCACSDGDAVVGDVFALSSLPHFEFPMGVFLNVLGDGYDVLGGLNGICSQLPPDLQISDPMDRVQQNFVDAIQPLMGLITKNIEAGDASNPAKSRYLSCR
jgi:hypothetical protein